MKKSFIPFLFSIVFVGCIPADNLETAALNQRITDLEHQVKSYQHIVNNTLAAVQHCQSADNAKHASYPEFDIEVDPDLLDWYYAQPLPEYDQLIFTRVEGTKDPFYEKALENPEEFIKLIALINFENPLASMALSEVLKPEHYPVLISYLKSSYAIAELAYSSRLYIQFEKDFVEAFNYWNDIDTRFIPSPIVSAIIKLDRPELFEDVRNYAIHGFGRKEIFLQLERYQPHNLDKLALTAWDNLQYDDGRHNIIEVAFVAAKYAGSQDALFELAIQWELAEQDEKTILREELAEIISLPSFKHFDEDVAKLEYKPSTKRWYMPS